MKKKYYAVKKGFNINVFDSWEECKESIDGFPNAEYKHFLTYDEAIAYINGVDLFYNNEILPRLDNGKTVAFIDGSYDDKKKAYGSGIYIIINKKEVISLSQKGNNSLLLNQKNVVGEIIAAHIAIDWAISNNIENLTIFYDYEGIEKWATGIWKTKTHLTTNYKQKVDEVKDIVNIEFVKIKGHSNNKYNDIADSLAKGAINNKILNNYGANGYVVCNISEDDIDKLIGDIKNDYQGITFDKKTTNKIEWKLKFEKDNLNILLYSTSKLVVQGKLSNLFQIFTSCLIEKIDCGDFTNILKNAFRISINKSDLDKKLYEYMPNISDNIPTSLNVLLKQAIIDLENYANIDIEFSKYTFNAFRALDGVLKLNLYKYGIPLSSRNTYNMFKYDENSNKYLLLSKYDSKVSEAQKKGLEECYNYFYNNRHTLSHFGIFYFNNIDNTRFIESKEEANKIIKSVFRLIDKNL